MVMSQTAQTMARTLLARNHPEELRALYLKEKENVEVPPDKKASYRNSIARGRAISRLVKIYFMEYEVIYQVCVMQGFSTYNKGSRGS
jgi:hypothetical protein